MCGLALHVLQDPRGWYCLELPKLRPAPGRCDWEIRNKRTEYPSMPREKGRECPGKVEAVPEDAQAGPLLLIQVRVAGAAPFTENRNLEPAPVSRPDLPD